MIERAPSALVSLDLAATLAADINAAHAAVTAAVRSGLDHAKRAGELLIQAKQQRSHGEWLPWLAEHCPTVSPWTAQAYMRLARRWPELEAANAGRVTHLSTRAALQSLTTFSDQLATLSTTDQHAVLSRLETHDERLTSVVAIVRRDTQRRQHELALATYPADDRPTPSTDRVVRVIREETDHGECWTIRTGPNHAALDLRSRLKTLTATPKYVKRAASIKAMRDRAARLRAKAAALEQAARCREEAMKHDQRGELERAHGAAYVYAETVSFSGVSDDLARRLPGLPLEEQIAELFAQGEPGCHGYWGDVLLWPFSANGPGKPRDVDQRERAR